MRHLLHKFQLIIPKFACILQCFLRICKVSIHNYVKIECVYRNKYSYLRKAMVVSVAEGRWYIEKANNRRNQHYHLCPIVLDDLLRVTHFARQQEALFIQHINQKNNAETRREIERLQRELELMRRRAEGYNPLPRHWHHRCLRRRSQENSRTTAKADSLICCLPRQTTTVHKMSPWEGA